MFGNNCIIKCTNKAWGVVMKSFACLIRHDTAVRIYISIQLRKHHVRSLSTNVSKRGNLKFQSSAWQTSPMGPQRKKGVTDDLFFLSNLPQGSTGFALEGEAFWKTFERTESPESWWWIPFIHFCLCHTHVTTFLLTFYCRLLSLFLTF